MNTIVIGTQFGDEGKGKIVDAIAKDHDVVVRFHGGSNAGHTLIVDGVKTVLHLIPSGVLSGKTCFIGNGVAFNPEEFKAEINMLKAAGVDTSLVKVSENAHLVLSYHIQTDVYREQLFKIGSTKRGISPCYEDKFARRGIQVKDLFIPGFDLLEKMETFNEQRIIKYNDRDLENLTADLVTQYDWLKEHVVPANFLQDKKNILFEGAQSSLLDIDFGNYPYVTSSNCVANYAGVGAGVNLLNKPVEVLGVFKAYMTKVGEGPYPTCIEDTLPSLADRIREVGKEYGATTGRPRHIGWLDLASLKEVIKLNGVTSLSLMKSDVLCGLGDVKVYVGEQYTMDKDGYRTFKGWNDLDSKSFDEFVRYIEFFTETPITIVSYGPGREETYFRSM